MSVPWWVGTYALPDAFLFQAPNLNDAKSEVESAGAGLLESRSWPSSSQAEAAAKAAGFTSVSGGQSSGGGGQPGNPPPSGAPNPKGGTLDKSTIVTVTQWVLNQVGHCYQFGGAPGPNFTGCPDCSSFCNFAWGRIGQQSIPGYPNGTYDGTVHGPSTVTWLGSQGSITGSVPRDQAQAGDLATWQTHMGYCISNQEMVSAQTPANGVRRSGIDGFIPGEQLVILRLAVIGPGGITLPLLGLGDARQVDAVTREIAEASRMLVNTRMRLYATGKPNGRA